MKKKWSTIAAGILLSLFISPCLWGQTFSFLTLDDFYNRKIVDNELLNDVWLTDPDEKGETTFEAYYEPWYVSSDMAVLQSGIKWNFALDNPDYPKSKDLPAYFTEDFALSHVQIYALFQDKFNFTSNAKSSDYFIPALSDESTAQYSHKLIGTDLTFGNTLSPILKTSLGLSMGTSTNLLFHLSSPRLMTFAEGLLGDENIFHFLRLGLTYKWIKSTLNTDPREAFVKGFKLFQEWNWLLGKNPLHIEVDRLFNYLSFKARLNPFEEPELPMGNIHYIKGGVTLNHNFFKKPSSIYQVGATYNFFASYYNFHYSGAGYPATVGDSFVAAPYVYTSSQSSPSIVSGGMGYNFEFIFQGPLETIPGLVIYSAFYGWIVDFLVRGMGDDDQGYEEGKAYWFLGGLTGEEMDNRLFSRLTFGLSCNDADILKDYPDARDIFYFYIHLTLFI